MGSGNGNGHTDAGRYYEGPVSVRPAPPEPAPLQLATKGDAERWATVESVLGKLVRGVDYVERLSEAAAENSARYVRSGVELARGLAEQTKTLNAIALRVGAIENKPAASLSGVVRAVSDRGSKSEETLAAQLTIAQHTIDSNFRERAEAERMRLVVEVEEKRAEIARMNDALLAAQASRKLFARVVVAGIGLAFALVAVLKAWVLK